MSKKIRLLIVDDAVVIRKLLADAMSSEPLIEVVGLAANGRIALQKIPQCNPDVVTLDVEMPELDGLATLKELRKSYPKLPVVMFSTLTERGSEATMDALAAGASDYVTKPANVGSVAAGIQRVRDELIPKLKALCGVVDVGPAADDRPLTPRPVPRVPRPAAGPERVNIVAIGVSTGGPNALAELIPQIPRDFPVPIVIVQHMPPNFTRLLAERLKQKSNIDVKEAAEGDLVEPGLALVAPGNFHMTIVPDGAHRRVVLNQDPPENSCRPAVDVLFRSVVERYGGTTLGVILTGMGQDGLRGCELVKDAGGQVIAQDEESSVVWGMPGFVAKAGLADRVLPLAEIAPDIVRRTMAGRAEHLRTRVS